MRLPFFGGGSKPGGPLTIPLPELIHVGFLVYFRSARPTPPTVEQLKPVIFQWLDLHSQDPLRGALKEYVNRDLVHLQIFPRSEMPEPPIEMMSYMSRSEAEEVTLRESTHAILMGGTDVTARLRFGYWAALATARALAQAAGGVIIDPAIPRWLKRDSLQEPLPVNGAVSVWDEIVIPNSVDERGQGWITTKGMSKFGLPELQVRDVPPNLVEMLWPVVNGVAHVLLERAAQAAEKSDSALKALTLESELRFEQSSIVASAKGQPGPPPEGARGWTTLGLIFEPGKGDDDAFITLVPPKGFKGKQGVWLNSILSDLLGFDDTLRHVQHDTETMEAAHMQAMSELPHIRHRFQTGLAAGEQLLVKHGFPVSEGHNEYMWLVVNTWHGDQLRCQLANQPQYRQDLRAGMQVDLREADLFDWVLIDRDGEHYGGYTNRVVEREGER